MNGLEPGLGRRELREDIALAVASSGPTELYEIGVEQLFEAGPVPTRLQAMQLGFQAAQALEQIVRGHGHVTRRAARSASS